MALEFGAGCLGGAAGVVVGHPLDTIKVRLQTQCPKNPQYSGAVDCMKKIVQAESVRGLYKGMASPIAGVSLVNAIIFGVHGNIMKRLSNPESLASHAVAGGGAGFFQSFITSPMELIKTRMQIQENMGMKGLYKNPINCMATIAKTEGFRAVFRGQGITILREIPGFTTYFVTYEYMIKKLSMGEDPSAALILGSGGAAGAASWVVTYPVDVIKSRLQADGMGGIQKYRSMMHCLRLGLETEGSGFLTRGLSTAIVRSLPTNAVTFYVVSSVMKFAENYGINDLEEYGMMDIVNKSEEILSAVTEPVVNYFYVQARQNEGLAALMQFRQPTMRISYM